MLKQSAMAAVMAGLVLAGTAHGQVQLDPSLTPYKAVSGVSGAGTTYTVTVATGSGAGTIRLVPITAF